MSETLNLTAEIRTDMGKGASRRLRRAGLQVPAIIYGAEEAPQTISLKTNELNKAMQQETFYSQILNVIIDGSSTSAVVRDLQRNPATGRVIHIDFLRVSANRALNVNVPLHFINEDKCVGARVNGGSIAHTLTEVEITCLPADIPEFIEVDMENVDVGSSVLLSDLSLPAGVQIVALAQSAEHDATLAAVNAPRGVIAETDESDDSDSDSESDTQ
ncbi:MAG: 50S ribosomal protein L25/general stress protein Ctc [Gammaproteobacteria bacterium]|jgi:large subunit ribosomal protein L25|nr:50S ribosomal protein L25/general stress protein Ctc [Gammaproteobacteria bacterium]